MAHSDLDPNARQVGGAHYVAEYQHWDWVADVSMAPIYYVACASKYLVRWRSKNGVQDVEKALHYMEKLVKLYSEKRVQPIKDQVYNQSHNDMTLKLLDANKTPEPESEIVLMMNEALFIPGAAKVALESLQSFYESVK